MKNINSRNIAGNQLIFDRGRDAIYFGERWDSLLNGVNFNISADQGDEDMEFIFQEIENLFKSARNAKEKFGGENWTRSIGDLDQIGKKLSAKHGKPSDCSAFWTVVSFSSCID